MQGVLLFAVCDAMCDAIFQEERYEEEDGGDERILGSNFSPGRSVEVFELPDTEALFMPSNMDSSQMAFKFKEVSPLSLQYEGFHISEKNMESTQRWL